MFYLTRGVSRAFLQFHVGNRLAEIYYADGGEIYAAFETFDETKLAALCLSSSTTLTDAHWVGNMIGLLDFLALKQREEIEGEKAVYPP